MQGITVICYKKGGDPSVSSHYEWLPTVPSMPDAIHFSFIPITSLLRGVPGKGFLSHAINLYLRCKSSTLSLNLPFKANPTFWVIKLKRPQVHSPENLGLTDIELIGKLVSTLLYARSTYPNHLSWYFFYF